MWAVIGIVAGWIWNALQASIDVIVSALVWAYHALKAFGVAAWQVGKFTWENVLKPIGRWLDRVYERFKTFYEKVFAPIHQWLQRISKALRTIYSTYFAPVLSTIDAMRKTLKLLELLHVQWAKQLDDALGRLEQKIAAPLLEAIKWVNYLDDTISRYVLTVDRLLQPLTLLRTLKRDWAPVANVQWNALFTTVPAGLFAPTRAPVKLAPASDHLATLDAAIDGSEADAGLDNAAAFQVLDDALGA